MTAGELGGYLAASGRVWVNRPPAKSQRKPVDGPPVLGSRALAIADSLAPADRERIKDQAAVDAAAVMSEWERRRGR